MEEKEITNGEECGENGNVAVENPQPVHVLTNGSNHLHQIENTLVVQKQLRNTTNAEHRIESEPVILKPYTNGNGVHLEDGKPYTNGHAKKKPHGGGTEGVYGFEHSSDQPIYIGANHVNVPDENCPDMFGDTIDTLKQYTTQIDKTLESLEQCQNELSNKLAHHNKARTITTDNQHHHQNNDGDSHINGSKTENHCGNKNENHSKNEKQRRNVDEEAGKNDNDKTQEEFLPMLNIDDEEEEASTIPDVSDDQDMLIQEKIMQSKSELLSKLNSQEQMTNLIIGNQDEVVKSQHCSSTETTDDAMCPQTSSSSSPGHSTSCSSSSARVDDETRGTENKELTLFESCRQGRYETVREILRTRENVDVNMTDGDSWSCLHEVSIRNCQFTPIVELLLQNGADPNLRDKKGETPLHGAVLFHLVDTIKLLLKYNGDCNVCNNTNVSPLKLATYLKDNEILSLFGHPISEEKATSSVKKKKKKKKRNSDKNFTLPLSTSPSILKKRRASDEPCSSTTTRSKKRINFSL